MTSRPVVLAFGSNEMPQRSPSDRPELPAGKSPPKERRERRTIRFNASEWADVAGRAHQCGMAVSEYVREAALGARPVARPNQIEQDAIYHLARIGSNLNQLTKAANTPNRLVSEGSIQKVLDELLAWVDMHG